MRNADGADETLPNDAVFTMIGREAPLDFFRRSGVAITGEMGPASWAALAAFVVFCTWLYHWKGGEGDPPPREAARLAEPRPVAVVVGARGDRAARSGRPLVDPATLLGTLRISASGPSFCYTLAYSLIVVVFGIRRIRRRRTPYVTVQTADADRDPGPAALPAARDPPAVAGPQRLVRRGCPEERGGRALPGGELRPRARVLARLRPHPGVAAQRLQLSSRPSRSGAGSPSASVQTFVLIPPSSTSGARAPTAAGSARAARWPRRSGDTHRHKMPHGPRWNRAEPRSGRSILAVAVVLLAPARSRAGSWPGRRWPTGSSVVGFDGYALVRRPVPGRRSSATASTSGSRGGCGAASPARSPRSCTSTRASAASAILAEKKKCISCNVCTTVCHQGIDVMNFANKGLPMARPRVRALLGLRAELPDRRPLVRAGRPRGRGASCGATPRGWRPRRSAGGSSRCARLEARPAGCGSIPRAASTRRA